MICETVHFSLFLCEVHTHFLCSTCLQGNGLFDVTIQRLKFELLKYMLGFVMCFARLGKRVARILDWKGYILKNTTVVSLYNQIKRQLQWKLTYPVSETTVHLGNLNRKVCETNTFLFLQIDQLLLNIFLKQKKTNCTRRDIGMQE